MPGKDLIPAIVPDRLPAFRRTQAGARAKPLTRRKTVLAHFDSGNKDEVRGHGESQMNRDRKDQEIEVCSLDQLKLFWR
jgi:hypothetical protein